MWVSPGMGRVSPLFWGTAMLGVGILFALAGTFLHPIARLFLSRERAAAEVRQFAQSVFLERELSRTQSRSAILVLVSQFERRASIVADRGITQRIAAAALDEITSRMDATLGRSKASEVLRAGLLEVERLLVGSMMAAGGGGNEIPEELMEMEGPTP
jgi:putative membrane protein